MRKTIDLDKCGVRPPACRVDTRVNAFSLFALLAASVSAQELRLPLRTRVEAFRGSGEWQEVTFERRLPATETALIVCDMWDKHWCRGASERVDQKIGRAHV